METQVQDRIEPLAASLKSLVIPEISVKIALGAEIGRKGDQAAIRFEGETVYMHESDLELSRKVARRVREKIPRKVSPGVILTLASLAQKFLSEELFRPGAIRVLFYAVQSKASAFYRCLGPMYALNMSGKASAHASVAKFGREALDYDVIVIQIDHSPAALEFVKALQKMGKKVVYEIDDAFHKLEPWHPQYASYGQPERIAAVHAMMRQADAVQVSTEWLADEYIRYSQHIHVVPNMIELSSWPVADRLRKDGLWKIAWAGSTSHAGDLELVVPPLAQFARAHPDVRIVFFGQAPNDDRIPKDQVEVMEFCEFEEYPFRLAQINADVAIAPLQDIDFNRGKSNLRILQYWATGYPVIASDVGPYRESIRHGEDGFLATDSASWLHHLEATYRNTSLLEKVSKAGGERVKEWDVHPNIPDIESFYSSLMET